MTNRLLTVPSDLPGRPSVGKGPPPRRGCWDRRHRPGAPAWGYDQQRGGEEVKKGPQKLAGRATCRHVRLSSSVPASDVPTLSEASLSWYSRSPPPSPLRRGGPRPASSPWGVRQWGRDTVFKVSSYPTFWLRYWVFEYVTCLALCPPARYKGESKADRIGHKRPLQLGAWPAFVPREPV